MFEQIFGALCDQMYDANRNMADFTILTKRVIKSLARSEKSKGAYETCRDIVAHGFTDQIMDDLRQEIATAFVQYANASNTFVASRISDHSLFPVFDIWEVDGKTMNGYVYLCAVVRRFLDDMKNPKTDLVADFYDDYTDNDTCVSPSRVSEYIKKLSVSLNWNELLNIDSLDDFYAFMKDTVKPELYYELAEFSFYLINGAKIRVIASMLHIDESRAYWLRKKLAKVYIDYKQSIGDDIARKTVSFAKIELADGTTTYKRVNAKKATLSVGDASYKVPVYVTPSYTIDNGYAMGKNHCMVKNIIPAGGQIVTPKEHTRIKSYVVNMTKKAYVSPNYCKYYLADSSANGSYQFAYTTGMTEYKPIVCDTFVERHNVTIYGKYYDISVVSAPTDIIYTSSRQDVTEKSPTSETIEKLNKSIARYQSKYGNPIVKPWEKRAEKVVTVNRDQMLKADLARWQAKHKEQTERIRHEKAREKFGTSYMGC